VYIGPRRLRKPLEKVLHQLGLEIPYALRRKTRFHDAERAAAKIDRRCCQRFIHRHQEVTGTRNTLFIAQRRVHRCAQRNSDIFHRVVLIHMQIALGHQSKVESTVPAYQVQHVIEKWNSRGNLRFSAPVQIQSQFNLSFFRFPPDCCDSCHFSRPFAAPAGEVSSAPIPCQC
jgi:hypothetical protein